MGLIINNEIQKLMNGYPTVSDKYNVTGGTLAGSTAVKFGEPVQFSSTAGYFESVYGGVTAATDIAGFVLATNVKLNETWPMGQVQVNPGEAFNLTLPDTFMAVELDSDATLASATANSAVHIILATGKLTTVDKYSASTIVPLSNVVFTGVTELQGTKKVAEIYIK